jgi:molybdopterin converting factor small subunit
MARAVRGSHSPDAVDAGVRDDERTHDAGSRSRVKILFYGRLAEAIGRELEVDFAPGCSVAELRGKLVAQFPAVADALRSKRALTCVGDRLVRDGDRLGAGETLEFLPPVSGG